MKILKLLVCGVFTFAFLLTALSVSAHVLKTDGSIGAVLHIDPNDDPIVGQEASLFFEFKDTKNKFSSRYCDCKLTISKGNEVLLNQGLTATTDLSTEISSFTFPEKGVYTVNVIGTSTDSSFDGFNLEYDLRVDREETTTGSLLTARSIPYIGVGIILAAFGFFYLFGRSKNAKLKMEKK